MTSPHASAPRRPQLGRAITWVLALGAVVFIAWIVPIRDQCWDEGSPRSTRVAVSRGPDGCVLHLRTGDMPLASPECAKLKCEPGLASTMARARPGVLVALLALYGFGTIAWAGRWRALLGFAGIDLPLFQVWRISIEAQAGGIVLPGGLGGDALRIASVLSRPTHPGELRAPASIVVASVLLDRAVGLALIASVAALLGIVAGGRDAGPMVAVLIALSLGLAGGLVVLRHAPLHRIGWLSSGRVGRTVMPVLSYLRDPRAPRAIALAAAMSIVVAAVQFGVIRGLVFALGATPAEERWVYVGSAMAFIVAAVPALPGGWGTADATYVFFFGLAGLVPAISLAVCLLYRLFWYLSGVLGAILYVSRNRYQPVTASPVEDSANSP